MAGVPGTPHGVGVSGGAPAHTGIVPTFTLRGASAPLSASQAFVGASASLAADIAASVAAARASHSHALPAHVAPAASWPAASVQPVLPPLSYPATTANYMAADLRTVGVVPDPAPATSLSVPATRAQLLAATVPQQQWQYQVQYHASQPMALQAHGVQAHGVQPPLRIVAMPPATQMAVSAPALAPLTAPADGSHFAQGLALLADGAMAVASRRAVAVAPQLMSATGVPMAPSVGVVPGVGGAAPPQVTLLTVPHGSLPPGLAHTTASALPGGGSRAPQVFFSGNTLVAYTTAASALVTHSGTAAQVPPTAVSTMVAAPVVVGPPGMHVAPVAQQMLPPAGINRDVMASGAIAARQFAPSPAVSGQAAEFAALAALQAKLAAPLAAPLVTPSLVGVSAPSSTVSAGLVGLHGVSAVEALSRALSGVVATTVLTNTLPAPAATATVPVVAPPMGAQPSVGVAPLAQAPPVAVAAPRAPPAKRKRRGVRGRPRDAVWTHFTRRAAKADRLTDAHACNYCHWTSHAGASYLKRHLAQCLQTPPAVRQEYMRIVNHGDLTRARTCAGRDTAAASGSEVDAAACDAVCCVACIRAKAAGR